MAKTLYNSPTPYQDHKSVGMAHEALTGKLQELGSAAKHAAEAMQEMAVTLVKKPLGMSGLALVQKVLTDEEDKALLATFTGKGGMVMLSATAFKFALGAQSLTVAVSLIQLGQLGSDKPPQELVDAYATAFGNVLNKVVEWEPGGASVLDKLPPQAGPTAQVAVAVPGMWSVYPIDKMLKAERVPLWNADKLYQPVFGTSTSSRYYLVAGNEEVKVAARYSGTSLSLRIEGPQFNKHAQRIKEIGLDPKPGDKKPYASIHLTVLNDIVAAKALGAILLGLGIELRTKMPDIKVLKGK